MDLLMLYYNFVRPHMALKFGRLVKTPAMQAGLAAERISFREVFTSFFLFFLFAKYCRFDFDRPWQALWMKFSIQQHFPEEAPEIAPKCQLPAPMPVLAAGFEISHIAVSGELRIHFSDNDNWSR
jgi:hypothetical protein